MSDRKLLDPTTCVCWRVFGNMLLSRIFGPKADDTRGLEKTT